MTPAAPAPGRAAAAAATAADPGGAPLLAFEGLTKSFGRIRALEGARFALRAGRITALLGENGAGKSTAMNILAGLYLPDAGSVLLDGRPLPLGSPAASTAAGIGMVHQQFRLIERLTGFENVSLALHRGRIRQPRRPDGALQATMAELGFALDLSRPVWQLTLAQRQQLEVLRIVACGARVLVLDEPTSVLSPPETEGLFAIMRRIAASGRAVVLISHKIREVLAVADDVVVMRRGRVTHEGPAAAVSPADLHRLIMGDAARSPAPAAGRPAPPGGIALRLERLEVRGVHGLRVAGPVDLELRQGELAVVLGVTGNGQTELIEAIGGLRPVSAGRITVPAPGPRDFAFIPSQHLGTALAPGLPLADNAVLGLPEAARPILDPAAIRRRARAVAARFDVRLDPDAPLASLSGGNLQRIVLARELARAPSLIVADYPARGLDPGTADLIRAALVDATRHGAGVLVTSEDIVDSLAIATRVLIMAEGRIVADMPAAEADSDTVGRLLTGPAP